jgi:hypothetical protein
MILFVALILRQKMEEYCLNTFYYHKSHDQYVVYFCTACLDARHIKIEIKMRYVFKQYSSIFCLRIKATNKIMTDVIDMHTLGKTRMF